MQNRKLITCKLDTYFFLHSHCPSDPEPLWSGLSYCREAHTKEKRERRRKGMAAGNAKQRDGRPRGTPNAETDGNKRRGQCAEAGGCAEAHARRHGYGSSGPGHDFAGPFRNNPGRIARTPCPIRLAQRLRGRPRMPFRSAPETARPLRKRNPDAVPESRKARRGLRNRK